MLASQDHASGRRQELLNPVPLYDLTHLIRRQVVAEPLAEFICERIGGPRRDGLANVGVAL